MAGIVVFWSFGYTEMRGGDLWWHIAAGGLILENGSPWLVDSWSYTHGGGAWLNHEWLSDIIFFAWTSAFGLSGLAYWKWLTLAATYALLQQALFRICGDRLTAFAGAVVAVAIAEPFLDVRPHLYSLLNFCLLLALILERKPSRWLLAGLFAVWVNLHGGFFFGLLALAILLMPWRDPSVDALRGASLTLVVCVAACVLNPFGTDVYLYPLKYAFDDSSPYRGIAEWLGPFKEGGIQAPLFVWAIGLFGVAATSYLFPAVRRRCGIPYEGLALGVLTLAMSLTSRRFIPLFGISVALAAAPVAALLLRRLQPRRAPYATPAIALGAGLYLLLPYPQSPAHAFHYLTAEYANPVDTLDFIDANDLAGKVFSHYSWGGYMHLRTRGRMKVYFDGRADTVYDDQTYLDYLVVTRHEPGWLETIESSGAEYFLWPLDRHHGGEKSRAMLATDRWKLLHQDSTAYLLVRTDVELPVEIELPEDSAYRSLAIGQMSESLGNLQQAERHYQEALEWLPYLKPACYGLARVQARRGKAKEARARLEACARLYPGAVGLSQTRGLIERLLSE
jgi:tetratricopeptide (TPR) repeat protein